MFGLGIVLFWLCVIRFVFTYELGVTPKLHFDMVYWFFFFAVRFGLSTVMVMA
ncbi:hypothetical protein HanXRQr2_Chr17g0784301 [Helianthus annuus]|uniref:Uncharacterized protein n=1 Tax=Helianthus annuus TaxID=4232 RepID=A0A9K3DH70_HELAN|nr:hypothetical protein HanXRQr2_Chr17g0784301 [Helianthus annuus]KAJ0427811.1 hypothetical protein HanHA300_Chr17g0639231 [Helianthus annuus]KAJ0431713.1 hypothetical protein HanIR_Chr17g0851371 [Helianthus annuus]KAJ0446115.1 hypothetical protein HanHA89_Chr17g0690811 [Helianthus annuus]